MIAIFRFSPLLFQSFQLSFVVYWSIFFRLGIFGEQSQVLRLTNIQLHYLIPLCYLGHNLGTSICTLIYHRILHLIFLMTWMLKLEVFCYFH